MTEKAHEGLEEVKKNMHGMLSIGGLIVCALLGMLTRGDVLFGLVMGTVFISGLRPGKQVAAAIKENAGENLQPARLFGIPIAAIITGVIASVIIAVIRAVAGEGIAVVPEDNVVVQIIKHFFDPTAAVAVAAGLLISASAHSKNDE